MSHPLAAALAAVSAAIVEVAMWPTDRRIKEADRFADTIASGADVLWADEKAAKRAEISIDEVRSAITTGLAVLAHRPGGVTFAGLHWCTRSHPQCPGPGQQSSTDSRERSSRGAFYTPRALAEQVVNKTLVNLTDGVSSSELLSLRICDPAVGSGALLLAACRFLAAQLVTAWRTEAGEDLTLPAADAVTLAARRLAMRCLYGADLDSTSVEMARLACALLAPTIPDILRVRIVVGDSLVGYGNTGQLAHMDPACFPGGSQPLHWPLTFPEVYVGAGRAPGFDAVVSNPPFLGGGKITGAMGQPYRDYLVRALAGGKRGSADLAAYFALRCHDLIHEDGVAGIIATNTLAQGGTREVGLRQIVERGWQIVGAVKSAPWPGKSAALHYCVVWTAGGPSATHSGNWPRRAIGEPALPDDGDDYELGLLHAVARMAAA